MRRAGRAHPTADRVLPNLRRAHRRHRAPTDQLCLRRSIPPPELGPRGATAGRRGDDRRGRGGQLPPDARAGLRDQRAAFAGADHHLARPGQLSYRSGHRPATGRRRARRAAPPASRAVPAGRMAIGNRRDPSGARRRGHRLRSRDRRIAVHHARRRPRRPGPPDRRWLAADRTRGGRAMSAAPAAAREQDPVELAIVASRLRAVVRKMSNTLYRTGRSGVLNTARDFSCAIVSPADELLMAADSLPIHVLSGPDLLTQSMRRFHPRLEAGDAFLHNSPYSGNSHPADHCLLAPVVDAEGRHRFTVLVKAHQADCGNSLPTTYMGGARDVYAEGALIFPAVKIQSGYRDIEDIIRICEARIRVPEQWRGDYLAMVGAARIGERELLGLGD